MHNYYIINGFIEFHPAASTLRNLNAPEKVVVLNSPAGRCFLLLITRNGSIVTQQEFMEIVWEKNGMLVSPNTFYQNISILRKGLKKVGLTDDPVVTIPRVGLTLASGTDIKMRSSESGTAMNQEDAHIINEGTSAQALPAQFSLAQSSQANNLPPKAEQSDEELPEKPLPETARRKVPSSLLLWSMTFIALILLMLIMKINNPATSSRSHFTEYPLLADAGQCHVYIADKDASAEERRKTLSLVEKLNSSCSHYPWVYVTHYALLPRTSVIRCNKPMIKKNQCISEYYFRGLNPGD
ncbi:winged helix-turn-helix domain-containing protein [Pantoea anthophila]|uniref:transcriptional regulator n=1 Tax=Pantoea anthophila TaxID=470931 RepID=UPI002DBF7D48|nr:winged helix-turn-helix domain-containing protein [Pantoea anthophila]MEB7540281.1 winged helix-turn-helix domain-containing protein [Pantoea anthophila]